ncbi:hypothetical protein KT71_05307 [Congregibacter litoralis KT71]|uniref:Uncharacterized protein n=1 Tax=Congregibacter litoralis KT71 TaxID=314285 RepID=A4ABW5_9GAMM|nr:hypothetical protein KT71_05307 [Congregibacter litoralis KT71]
MSGTVLDNRRDSVFKGGRGAFLHCFAACRLACITAALTTFAPLSVAQFVDGDGTQCCSSLNPQYPAPTYYGASMFRDDDPRAAAKFLIAEPMDPPAPSKELLEVLEQQELDNGPMSPTLAPTMENLGAAYLAEGREREALKAFSRGVHLARVNGGLYTPAQIAMLEQIISIHVRNGNYAAADDQQAYLYRVKRFGQQHSGNDELREATLRYADWMRGVYLGDIDYQRFPRLVGINDLYDEAIDEIVADQGETSAELLSYLDGKIALSYLVSVYPGERETGFRASAAPLAGFDVASEAQLRFWRLQENNFRYGLESLQRKKAVVAAQADSSPEDKANAHLAIADWYQWHRRYAPAVRIYKEAWAIMAGKPGSEIWFEKTFGEPLELPEETVFNPGAVPVGTTTLAEVVIDFSVSRHGEAVNIDIATDATGEDAKSAKNRAYKYLRSIRFRPRLEDGKVVMAENMQRTYKIRY